MEMRERSWEERGLLSLDDEDGKEVVVARPRGRLSRRSLKSGIARAQKYGFRRWRPDRLQWLNSPRWLLVWFCAAVAASTLAGAIFPAITDTLERRFSLRSTESGLAVTMYDIAAALVVLFVSYYGEQGNKALWIGSGCVVLGMGSFLVTVPHFAIPALPQLLNQTPATPLCQQSPASLVSEVQPENEHGWLYFFLFAQTLRGIGATPLGTLALSFLDENLPKHMSPFYIAVKTSVGVLGMAVGTVIGGLLLSFNTDFHRLEPGEPAMTPGSVGFVGCWWGGFFVSGILAFLTAIPLLGYPKRLPRSKEWERTGSLVEQEVHQGTEEDYFNGSLILDDWSRLLPISKSLAKNPVFLFFTLRTVVETFFGAGFAVFMPKLLQHVFQFDEVTAALLCGCLVVLPVVVGTLLGGWVIQHWAFRVRGVLVFAFLTTTAGAMACLGILSYCQTPTVAGLNVPYKPERLPDLAFQRKLSDGCNAECGCEEAEMAPGCDPVSGISYASPCYAGCSHFNASNGEYENCSCAKGRSIRPGLCKSTLCIHQRNIFIVFWVIICLMYGMSGMPCIQSLLRSVPYQQRTFALGLLLIPVRLFGTILGPLFMGWVFDQGCLLWQRSTPQGPILNCLIYDNDSLIQSSVIAGVVVKVLAGLFAALPILLYRPPPAPPGEEPSAFDSFLDRLHLCPLASL